MTTPDLLRELIRIPSVNPDGDPGTDAVGEKRCAEYVGGFLRQAGADVRFDDILPGRPNVVARFPADRPGKPRLLFAPHTDTVSIVGMSIDPFGAEVRDGKIWGRGASDTKGPMAAMLMALFRRREMLAGLSHEIWFAGLMGEEAGQHGSKHLAANERFDFVVVGEPTRMQVVHAHKGSTGLTLRTSGQAVHSSAPEKGVNAIDKMIDVLEALRVSVKKHFAGLHHDVLGAPTFSLGTIAGGSKINIVPESCEAKVDFRTLPGQDLTPLFEALTSRHDGLTLQIVSSDPLDTDPSHPVIELLQACGADLTGAPWYCDAAPFAVAGSPAVALGPGSIDQAHTADEWISIADLEAGTAFFEDFLTRLA